ncbi:MAG TPA: hypothetical protein VHL11_20060, partial [Phototrophicaceae bacterium]|nr:hypothetical protein [Phototrophicaceae bacterium]
MNAVEDLNEVSNRVTVEDVRKLALPLGTRVLAGDGTLNTRAVTWTTVIFPEDNTTSKTPQSGEIILFASQESTGTPVTSDVDIIRWASDFKAAAVVMGDNISSNALSEARAYGIPLLALPPGNRARVVEKAIVSLLVDRKGQLDRRGTQIYRQLTQISSRNEGMPELINEMARLTNKSVIIQDKRLKVVYNSVQPQFVDVWDDVEQFLRKVDNL